MNTTTTKNLISGKQVVAGLIVASQCASQAQEAKAQLESLEPTTVIASRFENPLDKTSSSVSILTGEELESIQQNRLLDALNDLPGIQGLSTAGQSGAFGTIIVRGLPTKYTQVVVDGVRIIDSTNGLNNFLTHAQTSQVTQVEFLRGPQSVMYGSEAAAGVIGFDTAVGEGEPTFSLFTEAGSFDSYRVAASAQGVVEDLQYAVELNKSFTSNDTYEDFPLQDYGQESAVMALRWIASDDLSFKLSYRGSDNNYQTQSLDAIGEIQTQADTSIHLLSLNTDYVVNSNYRTKVTLGYYDEQSDTVSDYYGAGASPYNTEVKRFTANWSNQLQVADAGFLVAGLDYNQSKYENSSNRKADYNNLGVYANGFWDAADNLLVEGGLRYDEHNEHGGDLAWNIGSAYLIEQSGTRLRARAARSFRTPTLLDTEAFDSPFGLQLANNGLKTETVMGYEIGLDQEIAEDHELQVTYFYQALQDAIVDEVISPGSFVPPFSPPVTQRVNQDGNSLVSGVESALDGSVLNRTLNYRLAWTVQLKEEVIDVPDHTFSGNVYYDAEKWLLGLGATYADPASYGASNSTYFLPADSRFVTRVYGSYNVSENLKLHGRLENLFNEQYNVANTNVGAIKGQGFGAFGGLTLTF